MDITNEVSRLNMELEGRSLMLFRPQPVDLKFAKFNKEFTINQFTGDSTLLNHSTHFQSAPEVLYLKIPKDLELNDYANLYIHYVGEE